MQTQMLIEGVSAWIDRVRYLKRVLQNSGMNWGKQGRQGEFWKLRNYPANMQPRKTRCLRQAPKASTHLLIPCLLNYLYHVRLIAY